MLSFDYYNHVFDNNWLKINQMKNLITKDFKQIEITFFRANSERNFKSMRVELHKLYPIVSNLRHDAFIDLIKRYLQFSEYTDELALLNGDFKKYLDEIYQLMSHQ